MLDWLLSLPPGERLLLAVSVVTATALTAWALCALVDAVLEPVRAGRYWAEVLRRAEARGRREHPGPPCGRACCQSDRP